MAREELDLVAASGRLHLRVRRGERARAQARRPRGPHASTTTAVATRSTRRTRCCRPRTRAARGSSRGTTTRSTTTTPATHGENDDGVGRADAHATRGRLPGVVGAPAGARAARALVERPAASTARCDGAGWRGSRCSTRGSTAARRRAATPPSSCRAASGPSPSRTMLGAAQERWLTDGLGRVAGRAGRCSATRSCSRRSTSTRGPGALGRWTSGAAIRRRARGCWRHRGARAGPHGRADGRHPLELGQRARAGPTPAGRAAPSRRSS